MILQWLKGDEPHTHWALITDMTQAEKRTPAPLAPALTNGFLWDFNGGTSSRKGAGGHTGSRKQLCIQDLPFDATTSDLSRTMPFPARGLLLCLRIWSRCRGKSHGSCTAKPPMPCSTTTIFHFLLAQVCENFPRQFLQCWLEEANNKRTGQERKKKKRTAKSQYNFPVWKFIRVC